MRPSSAPTLRDLLETRPRRRFTFLLLGAVNCTVSVRTPIRTGDPIRTELIQTSEHLAARSPRPSALLQCNARDRDAHNAPNPTQNGQGTRKWQQKWCARTARRRFLRPIQPAARTCAQALRGFKIGRRGPHRCSACLEPRFYLPTHDRSPHCPDICAHARTPPARRSECTASLRAS